LAKRLTGLVGLLILGLVIVRVLAALACGLFTGLSWEMHGPTVLLDWARWAELSPYGRELYLGLNACLEILVDATFLILALRWVQGLARS